MATETVSLKRESPEHIQSTVSSIKTMLKVGAVFAVVGYLLIGMALVLELTQFHPLLETFFAGNPEVSLAGGGSGLPRDAATSAQLAEIHKFPSTLL